MNSRIIINCIIFFIGTEIIFWVLLLLNIDFLNINLIGKSAYYIHYIHCFFILATIVFGVVQSFLYKRNISTICKYIVLYVVSYVLFIVLGGVLFSILDMLHGYFLSGVGLYHKLVNDQINSFVWGNHLMMKSFPFNFLVVGLSFFVLYKSRIFEEEIR